MRNKNRRKHYASDHMRRMAKVLMECRKFTNKEDASLSDFLAPAYSETLMQASLRIAGCTESGNSLTHPSVALKIGHDLGKVAEAKEILAIKAGDRKMEKEATDLLKVIQKQWKTKVSSFALAIQDERNFKKKNGPSSSTRSRETVRASGFDMTSMTTTSYKRAVILVQARLASFNKRRPGELESLR